MLDVNKVNSIVENKPILSICIVSYNRKEELRRSIDKLLMITESTNIEIVVSDEGSTDGTVKLMHEYERKYNEIKFYTRDVAYGAIKNWMAALLLGSGEYVMTLNDRDTIEIDNLNDLIDILRSKNDLVAGYCVPCYPYDYSVRHCKSVRYYKRMNILLRLAYKSLHPSGYFFKRKTIEELPCFQDDLNFFQKENVGYWPHDFVVAECFDKGEVLIYKKRLVVMAGNEYIAKHRSGVDSSSVENLWFSPSQRLVQLKRIIKHIQILPISSLYKFLLINQAVYQQLKYATTIYAEYRKNEYECKHYGIETKKITIEEIKKIIIEFKREYFIFLNSKEYAAAYKLTAELICIVMPLHFVIKNKLAK